MVLKSVSTNITSLLFSNGIQWRQVHIFFPFDKPICFFWHCTNHYSRRDIFRFQISWVLSKEMKIYLCSCVATFFQHISALLCDIFLWCQESLLFIQSFDFLKQLTILLFQFKKALVDHLNTELTLTYPKSETWLNIRIRNSSKNFGSYKSKIS